MRPHSIREYFRTQMGSIGAMPTDYIECMIRHSISTYDYIQNKDTEFLRSKYAIAGLSIKHKEKADIYDFVEDMLKSKGYSIDTELLRRVIFKPHRTVYSLLEHEAYRRSAIRSSFMEMLRREFLKPNLENQTATEPRMDTS